MLVDGLKNFPRVLFPLRRLTLTKLKVPVLRGARTSTLAKAAKAFSLDTKWAETKAFQKLQRFERKSQTTDLDRFKVMINRKQRSYKANHIAFKSAKPASKSAAKPAKGKKWGSQMRVLKRISCKPIWINFELASY